MIRLLVLIFAATALLPLLVANADIDADCRLCHKSEEQNHPCTGISNGFTEIPGNGCAGCHGMEEGEDHDSEEDSSNENLSMHNWIAGISSGMDIGAQSVEVCTGCHTEEGSVDPALIRKFMKYIYFANEKKNADKSCNPVARHALSNNGKFNNFIALYNERHGPLDLNNTNCGCVLTDIPDNNCDGIDDDCDGLTDEDYFPVETTCGVGACETAGQLECLNGIEVDNCVAGTAAADDTECNGVDDDCDGLVDEDYFPVSIVCGSGVCSNSGFLQCQDGTLVESCVVLTQAEPADITCDGLDGDCDGLVDEDYIISATSCGTGECASIGQTSCIGGAESDSCTAGTPVTELCDGLDNDCDNSVDEDFADLGTVCSIGVGACESMGSNVCALDGSGIVCDAVSVISSPEGPETSLTCSDAIDNDCDGQTDFFDADCAVVCTTPPPVRQEIGIPDVLYNSLVEADCRFCHENPEQFPVQDVSIPDRHHLLIDTAIPDPTDAPFGEPGDLYECLICHESVENNGTFTFIVERDCLVCHVQAPSGLTVHHRSDLAQGDLPQGPDCQACHGDIVDNMEDGHYIPVFDPMPETPKRSGGTGLPFNCRGDGAGACNYCHDNGISPEGVVVETTMTTHHNTGFGSDPAKCDWCHNFTLPFEGQIRTCENCHGRDSLHSIQADSDGDNVISAGIELPFYGHIGNPDDCWGCHGYGPSALTVPVSGPVVPVISSISDTVITQGADTAVTISGSAFTSINEGTELSSDVILTASDGTATTLVPDLISQDSITVTIPGNLEKGNYRLITLTLDKQSNPIVITVIPDVVVTSIKCKEGGVMTIAGSGFSEIIKGSDDYIGVEINGIPVDILSWSDSLIKVNVSTCYIKDEVRVNTLFGSALSAGDKPPKPCNDKGC